MGYRNFDPFKVFLDPETKTALVLNPKVMTTFLTVFIRDGLAEFRGLSDPSNGRYKLFQNARNFPVMPLSVYWDFHRNHQDYTIFAFVRNPYDRTLSAWKDKFFDPHNRSVAGERAAYPRSIKGRELTKIRRFAKQQRLPGADDGSVIPFPSFLAYIQSQPQGSRNRHWDAQTSVIRYSRFAYRDIFRIEDQLEQGFRTIFDRLGFDPEWTQTRLNKPLNASSISNLEFYDPQTRTQVAEIYRNDFENFGYVTAT